MSLRLFKSRPVAAALLVLMALALWYLASGRSASVRYVTAPVTRGSVVRTVNATGTVNPVIVVQVGSYVSGPIQAIYADFNSPVKQGQLIAKIDPRPFQVKYQEALAALDNSKAMMGKDEADSHYKKLSYDRQRALLKSGAVSRDAVDSAYSSYRQSVEQVALDHAMVEQQQAAVQEAKVNLDYTDIISPVDGTVISRNVDVGQTVAASFQTPTLFLIARDLTQMQVDSNVSESDIGNVRVGQTGTFKVDAFPERTFEGTVGEVRQAPITVQNVVTYDVVVNVSNPELLLKPGMTANLTIVTDRRDNVTRIPEQALRFKPQGIARGEQDRGGVGGEARAAQLNGSHRPHPSNQTRVWKLEDGKLTPVTIKTGLDDGENVEVLSGRLTQGETVVVDEVATGNSGGRSGPHGLGHFR